MAVDNVISLRATSGGLGQSITLAGYYSPGDLGGGEFYWASTAAGDNGGTIFTANGSGYWVRVLVDDQINARWFGATGDGSTDDTSNLQTVINFCGDNHYKLYLPDGVYIVSGAWTTGTFCLIIAYDNFVMEGQGFNAEIRNKNFNDNPGLILVQSSNRDNYQITNVVLRNFQLNGNKENQNNSSGNNWHHHCLIVNVSNVIDTAANILIENLYCHDAYSYDAESFEGEGGGIALSGVDKSFPPNVNELDYPPQNITVQNCVCYNNDGWGIGTNWNNRIQILNNTCYDNQTMGVTVWGSQDVIIEGNICYDNFNYEINTEASDRVIISNNNVRNTGYGGFNIYNSIDVIVDSNHVTQVSNYWEYFAIGIRSGRGYGSSHTFKQRPSSKIQISNNSITKKGGIGYVVNSYLTNPVDQPLNNFDITVCDNIIINEDINMGISLVADNFKIVNNTIRGFVYCDSPNGDVLVRDNKIYFGDIMDAAVNPQLAQVNNCVNLLFKENSLHCDANGDTALNMSSLPTGKAEIFDNVCSGAFYAFFRTFNSALSPILRCNLLLNLSTLYMHNFYPYTLPPTSGTWHINTYLENPDLVELGSAGSKYIVKGWVRLTTGSGNTVGTDWISDNLLTGN